MYGKDKVVYTGADYPFGYGCDGARPNTPSGIEYLLTNITDTAGRPNRLVTPEFREHLVFLNLYYCGGILGGLDYENAQRTFLAMLARLPRLAVLSITFGKRQRPGVKVDFAKYAQTPYGFRIIHTFADASDNQRVVSRTFVRDFGIPRTFNVPGMMWHWNQSKSATAISRLSTWKCVIKSFEPQSNKFVLYSIYDDKDNIVLKNLCDDDVKRWAVKDECVHRSDDIKCQMLH